MSLLEIHDLGKAYRGYRSEWQRIARWLYLPVKPSSEHWIIRHITFSVEPGEAIAIVGQNGAGKSTLLKMIAGTLQPTAGHVRRSGRIAAILELGMGFNQELTGRQNAIHAAGLMGFNRQQIDEALPWIEEFAEVGNYFDEAVRTYSSGMQMRVAFAVATAIRPEVLIIDEALAVGDSYFQHKSFERLRSFQQQGTTLLIVSHDKGAIQAICTRALLLDQGTIIKDGAPEEVMDFYNAIISEKENANVRLSASRTGKVQTVSGSGEAIIQDVSILNQSGERIEFIRVGEKISLSVQAAIKSDIPELVMGYMIKDRLGQPVYGSNTHNLNCKLCDLKAGEVLTYTFTFDMNVGIGSYSVAIALHTMNTHLHKNYEWRDLALVFNVVNYDKDEFIGLAWLPPQVECIR